MTKELFERLTCRSCGHIEQRKPFIIKNLGQFIQVKPPLHAALIENFTCPSCGDMNNADSEFFEAE